MFERIKGFFGRLFNKGKVIYIPVSKEELEEYGKHMPDDKEETNDGNTKTSPDTCGYFVFSINKHGDVAVNFDVSEITKENAELLASLAYCINEGYLENALFAQFGKYKDVEALKKFVEHTIKHYQELIHITGRNEIVSAHEVFGVGKTGNLQNKNKEKDEDKE